MTKQQTRKSMAANKYIHKEWQDRCNNDDGTLYKLLGEDCFYNIVNESGDCCYACGRITKLQRCHIVPHSCGGSEDNNNLFLMCEHCHSENPDTVFEDIFYSYVRNRKHYIFNNIIKMQNIVNTLYADSTKEEQFAFDNYKEDLSCEKIRATVFGDKSNTTSTGLYNAMSLQTMAGYLWKKMSYCEQSLQHTVTV